MCPGAPSPEALAALSPLLADAEGIAGCAGVARLAKWLLRHADEIDQYRERERERERCDRPCEAGSAGTASQRPPSLPTSRADPLEAVRRAQQAAMGIALPTPTMSVVGIDWDSKTIRDSDSFAGNFGANDAFLANRDDGRDPLNLASMIASSKTESQTSPFLSLDSAAKDVLHNGGRQGTPGSNRSSPRGRTRTSSTPTSTAGHPALEREEDDRWTLGTRPGSNGMTRHNSVTSRAPSRASTMGNDDLILSPSPTNFRSMALSKHVPPVAPFTAQRERLAQRHMQQANPGTKLPSLPPLPRHPVGGNEASHTHVSRRLRQADAPLPHAQEMVGFEMSIIDNVVASTKNDDTTPLFVPQGDINKAMDELEVSLMPGNISECGLSIFRSSTGSTHGLPQRAVGPVQMRASGSCVPVGVRSRLHPSAPSDNDAHNPLAVPPKKMTAPQRSSVRSLFSALRSTMEATPKQASPRFSAAASLAPAAHDEASERSETDAGVLGYTMPSVYDVEAMSRRTSHSAHSIIDSFPTMLRSGRDGSVRGTSLKMAGATIPKRDLRVDNPETPPEAYDPFARLPFSPVARPISSPMAAQPMISHKRKSLVRDPSAKLSSEEELESEVSPTTARLRKVARLSLSKSLFLPETMQNYERFPATRKQDTQENTQRWFDAVDRFWTPVLFMYTLYQLIAVPVRCGLGLNITVATFVLDLALDMIYVTEIAFRFRRPYSHDGLQIQSTAEIRKHYRRTDLSWDVCACFPVDLAALIAYLIVVGSPFDTAALAWFRLNKLMLGRYAGSQFVHVLGQIFTGSPIFVRACRTMLVFCLACHFTGCGFLTILRMESREDLLAFTAVDEMADGTAFQRYALLYDYSLKALVGMGRPGKIVPHTDLQTGYSIVVALSGVCLYALMLATIGNLVTQRVSNEEEWRSRRDAIHDVLEYFSRTHTIPVSFREEVRAYFHHEFWVSRLLLGKPHDIFGALPEKIGTKVNLHVGGTIFNRIPMFAAVAKDEEFVNFMVSRLEPKNYCRGEQIVTKGDEGDFMFFLMEGNVGIFDEALRKIVFVCGRGAALGEIALLQDCRRTATVVAIDFCSCFILTRESFLEAEDAFPDVIARVRREGEAKLAKMKVTELFAKLPILQPYQDDPEVLNAMMDSVRPEIYPPDTVILSKGELSDKLYFISQGEVGTGKWKLTDGDFFGATSCGLNIREVETVTSVGNVTLFALPKEDLWRMQETSPGLIEKIQLTAYAHFVEYLMEDVFGEYLHAFGCDVETDSGLFFERLSMILTENFIPAGTCVVAPGHPVRGVLFLAEGTLIEAYGDSLNYTRYPGEHFGSRCFSDKPEYVADTSLVAAGDAVIYMLSAKDLQTLREEFPKESMGFDELRKTDVLRTLARKTYSITTEGTQKRYFMRWLCWSRLRQDQRKYRYTGLHGPVLSPDSHILLSSPKQRRNAKKWHNGTEMPPPAKQ